MTLNTCGTTTWTGGGDGTSWSDGANWDSGTAPSGNITDAIVLPADACPYMVTSDQITLAGGSLTIGENVTLEVSDGDDALLLTSSATSSVVNNGFLKVTSTGNDAISNRTGTITNNNCATIETIGATSNAILNRGNTPGISPLILNSGTLILNDNNRNRINNGPANNSDPQGSVTSTGLIIGSISNGNANDDLDNGNILDFDDINTCPSFTSTDNAVCIGATIDLGNTGTYSVAPLTGAATVDGEGVVTGTTAGTVCVSLVSADGTCTITRVVTVLTSPTPVDAPFIICASTTSTDLTANNSTILDGETGTVTWFNGLPSTGSELTAPTTVNLNTVTDLWAKVTLTDCSACMDSVDVTVTINALPTLMSTGTTCSADLSTYTITFTSDGTVVSTEGTVDNTAKTVSGITSGTDVMLTATSSSLSLIHI